jgi:LPS export ABC transporter protein LptC
MLSQIKKRKVFIISSVALVIFMMAIFLMSRGDNPPENKLDNVLSDKINLQIQEINNTDVGDSGLTWEIKAVTGKFMKNENLAIFDKVAVKVITKDGKTFVMTGNTGQINTETKNIEISGDVSVVSDKGDHLTTDILKYSDSEQRVYTDSPVKLENPRMQVQGKGMTLSLKDQNVTLLSKIKARIN